jgi:hypothetical protein
MSVLPMPNVSESAEACPLIAKTATRADMTSKLFFIVLRLLFVATSKKSSRLWPVRAHYMPITNNWHNTLNSEPMLWEMAVKEGGDLSEHFTAKEIAEFWHLL